MVGGRRPSKEVIREEDKENAESSATLACGDMERIAVRYGAARRVIRR